MKPNLLLVTASLLATACHPGVAYRLTPDMEGQTLTLEGIVLSTETDGDFLLETNGRLAFVDADQSSYRPEMGDRVQVTGTVDADSSEAPELDATTIHLLQGNEATP